MLRKLTSLILLHFFTCTALLTFPLAEAGAKPVNNEALPNLNNISVPYHLGFITSSHDAPGAEKMVIHIRDAHCNYSSQKNIAAILQDLTTYNNLRLIGVEGAEKWINTALLSAIPGKEKRENVIEGLLSETVIHGSVAFAAKQENTEAMLFGIETKKLYIDNLQSHAELFINRKGALAQINKLKQELPGLAPLSKNKDISFAEGIGLIEKLLKISLTRNEYNKLIKNKLTFNSYLSLISEYSGSQGAGLTTVNQPDTLKKAYAAGLEFYATALKREDEFIDNLIRQMEIDDLNTAALVAGGFHSAGIEELLREKNISYVVIRPRITVNTPAGIYDELMEEAAIHMLEKYTAATPADPADSGRFARAYADEIAPLAGAAYVAALAQKGQEDLASEKTMAGAVEQTAKHNKTYREILWPENNSQRADRILAPANTGTNTVPGKFDNTINADNFLYLSELLSSPLRFQGPQ